MSFKTWLIRRLGGVPQEALTPVFKPRKIRWGAYKGMTAYQKAKKREYNRNYYRKTRGLSYKPQRVKRAFVSQLGPNATKRERALEYKRWYYRNVEKADPVKLAKRRAQTKAWYRRTYGSITHRYAVTDPTERERMARERHEKKKKSAREYYHNVIKPRKASGVIQMSNAEALKREKKRAYMRNYMKTYRPVAQRETQRAITELLPSADEIKNQTNNS